MPPITVSKLHSVGGGDRKAECVRVGLVILWLCELFVPSALLADSTHLLSLSTQFSEMTGRCDRGR